MIKSRDQKDKKNVCDGFEVKLLILFCFSFHKLGHKRLIL